MGEEFDREIRYLVLKHKDIREFLTNDEIDELARLAGKVDSGHYRRKGSYLNCVCVEDDWPEHELVWDMIEKRWYEENKNISHDK